MTVHPPTRCTAPQIALALALALALAHSSDTAGVAFEPGLVPDGFYLVGNVERPQVEWHTAIIDAVRRVTHIAPADSNGNIIGSKVTQEGCILYPTKELSLCSSVTNATHATTTEVYPDSPQASNEQCNRAQVAVVVAALDGFK